LLELLDVLPVLPVLLVLLVLLDALADNVFACCTAAGIAGLKP
jgi:hypothetical protein